MTCLWYIVRWSLEEKTEKRFLVLGLSTMMYGLYFIC